MDAPTRKQHGCDKPGGRHRTIAPNDIDARYIPVLRDLDPYLYFKYATIPWLYYRFGGEEVVEYSVFRKYLSYLRADPNNYIGCPEQQLASPNVDRKTLVYELRERGLNELINRRIIEKRSLANPDAKPAKSQRNHAFAVHRSNSYYHEVIVDLGYHYPLRYLTDKNDGLRLVDFAQLLEHPHVPAATRQSNDPLLIQLKNVQLRFDGTPHVIVCKRANGVFPLGIPGIQVDRTDSYEQIESHVLQALEFIEERHYERHWGFDNCLVPFLFTKEVKKNRAMQFLRKERGTCAFLLFQTIPDYGLLRHFPQPKHYARDYQYIEGEPRHPDNIHIFTNPWQRVGFPDFYLNTFDEIGAA